MCPDRNPSSNPLETEALNISYDFLFKIIIIGESGVGKSSLLMRYVDNYFPEHYISTIGVDFKIKTLTSDGKLVKLQIWDTAGQEKFRFITNSFYRGSHGVILVFDVTDQHSFDKIKQWVSDVNSFQPNAPLILVANKCDRTDKRVVREEDAIKFANDHGMMYVESSCKSGVGVETVFEKLTSKLTARSTIQTHSKTKLDLKSQPIKGSYWNIVNWGCNII